MPKARASFGSGRPCARPGRFTVRRGPAAPPLAAVQRAAYGHRWRRKDADEIREMRHRLEATVGAGDLKRGPGGIVDIEFLVQMLQLQHARKNPSLRTANTLAALRALHDAGLLSADEQAFFDSSYRLLRAAAVRRAAGRLWPSLAAEGAAEIREMRHRLEATVGTGDLKRGPGGIVNIEFLVQMLQLQHARRNPSLRTAKTLAALQALKDAGLMTQPRRRLSSSPVTACCGRSRAGCG